MTRTWAPLLKSIQEAIRTAIMAERTVQFSSLPSGLQASDFAVGVAADSDQPPAKPFTVLILPPERSGFAPEVTGGLEGEVEFRACIVLRAAADKDKLLLLREVVGLIMDGLLVDPTLGGLVAGWANPGVVLEDVTAEPGVVAQDARLRFVARA